MTLRGSLWFSMELIGATLTTCLTQPTFECKLYFVNNLTEKLL